MAITDLPFDPVRIRLKIHELRKALLGLETLLETYGLNVDGSRESTSASATTIEARPRRRTARRAERSARHEPARAVAKDDRPKLADLGVEVISKHGGRAHGKLIVEELRRAGHMLKVAHPDSNISTALSRDPRVERASDARNTWVLKKAS